MLTEALAGLPRWLVVGVVLGLGSSVIVAAVFVVMERRYPTATATSGPRWSGETRRRAELRRYLRAIEEPFAEDHLVEGQAVAFYLPTRDVAITFDARAYYRIERSPTYPVLVEHEMPGVHLGHRLPFDVPAVDLGDPAGEDSVAAAFGVLGLPASASLPEVKRAYRERVKEVHPDHGGDHEAFSRVREAYTTAKKHAA